MVVILTGKQHGYIVQALAEGARQYKLNGDNMNQRKMTATLQIAINMKQLDKIMDGFDEEQLFLIVQALEETAERRQIWATTYDAEQMRETAKIVMAAKNQREARWIEKKFREGIA